MIISRSFTGTIPLKNPKNLKNNPETWYVNKKILNNSGVFYIIRKVLKKVVLTIMFWKMLTEFILFHTSIQITILLYVFEYM